MTQPMPCKSCHRQIFESAIGRYPPWCPHCGAGVPPPVEPVPMAAVTQSFKQADLDTLHGKPPSLRLAQAIPFIHACSPKFGGKRCTHYRLFVTREDLLFFRCGVGGPNIGQLRSTIKPKKQNLFQSFIFNGWVGFLMGVLTMAMQESAENSECQRERDERTLLDRLTELEVADEATLREYVMLWQGAHVFAPVDLEWLHVDPPSFRFNYMCGTAHEGVLSFQHRDAGKLTFALPTLRDVRRAVEELPKLFPGLVQINLPENCPALRPAPQV